MKASPAYLPLALATTLFLAACSAHPGAGFWKATESNDYGISELAITYEGRAEFSTRHWVKANWRCFWGATDKNEATLDCTPSTDTERREHFTLTVNPQGFAVLRHENRMIGLFSRQAKDPSP